MSTDEQETLAAFIRKPDAETFGKLMQRHMGFVYAAALRQSRNQAGAEDTTQAVFLLLWQRAAALKPHVPIKAWLFKATRYVVANARRAEARRAHHEREAAVMRTQNTQSAADPNAALETSDVLDDALFALSENDRRAVLLRFFEDQPLASVGATLGISEAAAKKRVTRAVEKLRRFIDGRGIGVSAAAIPSILISHATAACPAGLSQSVLQLVLNPAPAAGASASAVSLAKGASHMMLKNQLKILAFKCVAAVICVSSAAAVVTQEASSKVAAVPPVTTTPHNLLVAAAQTAPAVAQSDDPEFDGCRGAVQTLMDAYEQHDMQKLKSVYCATTPEGQKTLAAMLVVSEVDVAGSRVRKTAIDHFGTPAAGLFIRITTIQTVALDLLSRIGPQDIQEKGDETILTPSSAVQGLWPSAIYFHEASDGWKIDIGRTVHVSYRVKRIQPIAGESDNQAFVAGEGELARGFNAIADQIDQGKITNVVDAQASINRMFTDLATRYSALECNVNPK